MTAEGSSLTVVLHASRDFCPVARLIISFEYPASGNRNQISLSGRNGIFTKIKILVASNRDHFNISSAVLEGFGKMKEGSGLEIEARDN